MKNTGITYTSAERSPVILPEMAELLPPLSAEQSAALEEDLLRNGCYAPIIVNEDMVIVDGHNRQSLCEKHGLPYTMAVFSFEDLLEAKQWALDTQKGRRNLEKWELGKIALKLKPEIEAKARANQGTRTDLSATLPESSDTVDTRKELAEAVGLGERTMGKVMQIDANAPEVIKEALDKKELSINKGYDLTRQLQDLPEEQREQAAAEALEYEKAKKELKKQDAEIDRKGKIAALFCKAYEKAVLLTPSEENIRCWTDGTRMTPEEMRDTVKESRELAEQAELKQSFLNNMSHEIRTPLNAIVGFSDMLANEPEFSNEERQEFVDIINTNTKLLLKLVGDVLELSRIESGNLSFTFQRESVCRLLDDVYQTHSLLIRPPLQFLKDFPPEDVQVNVDPMRLTQVLTNFLNNANKFTKGGSIRLGYCCPSGMSEVHLYVEDTGIGIPHSEQKMIFERFYKRSEFSQGVGLGLSICVLIVEKMGGRIELQSEEGRGSRFTVVLPCIE